ncbi:MAG: amidohydrolase [Desulfobacteraceae bacterium]|nr:MAG: amidohydrolase [Desulfobacteraceae bacterium]
MKHFNLLIKNVMILTMDSENKLIEKGFVGIKNDLITEVGTDLPKEPFQADQTLDVADTILLPGLINGHTHAPMTLFRGLADDLPLMEWLQNYIFPVESHMDADFVSAGALLACAEMIRSGTTCFCDMYLFADEVAKAAKKSGMRALIGEVLYDFNSPNYGSIENGFKYTEDLILKWRQDPLITIAVEPHAPYTCSPALLQKANEMALKYQTPLVIHLSETLNEIEQTLQRYGKRPVAHLESLGLLKHHLIADHCVHVNEAEIESLANNKVKVIHNPESNMKLAAGVAPIMKMLQCNITVGLGTDGCASNNNLDLFSEMDMTAKLHKVHSLDPTVMDALTVLRMATAEGAKALGLGSITGSIEKGKKADLILVHTRQPHLTPLYSPYSHLVYAARGSDVTHTVINGVLVMENRRLLTLNEEEILAKANEKSKLVKRWVARPSA